MRAILDRLSNEPALVGSLIIAVLDCLVAFDVLVLTIDQFATINAVLALLVGGTVRQSVYSKRSYGALEGELLSQ